MLRDSRIIASLYTESVPTATPNITTPMITGQQPSSTPTTLTVPSTTKPVLGGTEAAEEKKEKQLPAKNWVKVDKIVKDDVREIDNIAHEITSLVHGCCEDDVIPKVMSKVFKKHRQWSKK